MPVTSAPPVAIHLRVHGDGARVSPWPRGCAGGRAGAAPNHRAEKAWVTVRNAITVLVLLGGGLLVAREAAVRRGGGGPAALREALSRAIAVGDAREATRLLKDGAPPDGCDEYSGATPLI